MAAGKSCHHADNGQLQLKVPNKQTKIQLIIPKGEEDNQARLNIQKTEPSDNVSKETKSKKRNIYSLCTNKKEGWKHSADMKSTQAA